MGMAVVYVSVGVRVCVCVCEDTICNDTQISILNGCLIAQLVVL